MPTTISGMLTTRFHFKKALFESVSNNPDFMLFTGGDGSLGALPCFGEEQGFVPDGDRSWQTHPNRAFYRILTDEPISSEQGNYSASKIDFRITVLSRDTSSMWAEQLDGILRAILDGKDLNFKSTGQVNEDLRVWRCEWLNLVDNGRQEETNYWRIISQYSITAHKRS